MVVKCLVWESVVKLLSLARVVMVSLVLRTRVVLLWARAPEMVRLLVLVVSVVAGKRVMSKKSNV